jgi:hypothetical protein
MIDNQSVQAWVSAYERVWRTAGTDQVADLFTTDATYRMAPFKDRLAASTPSAGCGTPSATARTTSSP